MRGLHLVSIILLAAVGPLAAQGAPPAAQSDTIAIRDLYKRFSQAFAAEDVATLVECFAEDGMLMAPREPTHAGRDQLRQRWEETAATEVTLELRFTLDELVIAGEWAYARGTFTWRGIIKPGEPEAENRGRYLDILRRERNGSWVIARRMRN